MEGLRGSRRGWSGGWWWGRDIFVVCRVWFGGFWDGEERG